MIPSDRARARDGRLAGLWILAPQGLRASPTRSIFVTLTFRVLTPMISTRHGRVQAPLGYRAARRATTPTGYRPVHADRRRNVRAVLGRTGAVHDGPTDADPGRPPGARQAMRKSRPPRAERQRRHGVRAPQGHTAAHDGPAGPHPGCPPGARRAMREPGHPRAERRRRHGVRTPQGHVGAVRDGRPDLTRGPRRAIRPLGTPVHTGAPSGRAVSLPARTGRPTALSGHHGAVPAPHTTARPHTACPHGPRQAMRKCRATATTRYRPIRTHRRHTQRLGRPRPYGRWSTGTGGHPGSSRTPAAVNRGRSRP